VRQFHRLPSDYLPPRQLGGVRLRTKLRFVNACLTQSAAPTFFSIPFSKKAKQLFPLLNNKTKCAENNSQCRRIFHHSIHKNTPSRLINGIKNDDL